MRILLVWLIPAALLPSAVAAALPRRMILVFPLLQTAMALPLVALGTALYHEPRVGRFASLAAPTLLLAAGFCSGFHRYFNAWDDVVAWGANPPGPGTLDLVKVVKGLPPEETVLVPDLGRRFRRHLDQVERLPRSGESGALVTVKSVSSPEEIRRTACAQSVPFHWVTIGARDLTGAFDALERDFALTTERAGSFLVYHLLERKPRNCEQADSPRLGTGRVGKLPAMTVRTTARPAR